MGPLLNIFLKFLKSQLKNIKMFNKYILKHLIFIGILVFNSHINSLCELTFSSNMDKVYRGSPMENSNR